MSESKLTGRKRGVAFLLKNGKRGFAVEYAPAPYLEGYARFVDCSVWPEDQPDRLEELSILEVPAALIERVEVDGKVVLGGGEEAGTEEEKARTRRKRAE
jgi:hypothetical protein